MSGERVMSSPHRFRMLTVQGIYLRMSVLLCFLIALAGLRSGVSVLLPAIAAAGGALAADLLVGLLPSDAEVAGRWWPGSGLRNGRALYLGLLVAALAPQGSDPMVLAGAAAAAVVLGVWVIGGTGTLWMHPSLLALALIPQRGTGLAEGASVQGSAAVGDLLQRSGISAALESSVFVPLDLSVTPDALTSVVSVMPESAVSLSAGLLLALLPVAMVVFGEDIVPPLLPISYLLAFVLVVDLLGGSVLAAMAGGNAPVIALLALPNPGARPRRLGGLLAYGVIAGLLGAVLTVSGSVALPAVSGVLLAATLVPLADWLGERRVAA